MSTNSSRREDDSTDNAGKITMDSSGHLSVGIGGGLGIDATDGDVTYGAGGGLSIDTGA